VIKGQILNKRELSEALRNILNSVLQATEIHYFSMNTKQTQLKQLSEFRFSSMIFLFRMAGIPLKMKKLQTIHAVYMISVIVCSCSTFIGMFVDVYINWDDLGRAMTTIRMLFSITNVIWIFAYCR
jgi:hypothetical protein